MGGLPRGLALTSMARSVLKPHAATFVALFRVCDPASTVVIGVIAYGAYLGSFSLPDHYLFFLAAGAFAAARVRSRRN